MKESCKPRFYVCPICGNFIEVIYSNGGTLTCCGREMQEVIPGSDEMAFEKHLPVVEIDNCKVNVNVGSTPHPMEEDHHILWIELVTDKGCQRKFLHPGDKPCTTFKICKHEKVLWVYEYCNLHGLWMTTVKK